MAANIPGTALVIGGNTFDTNLASSHVLSHEMGHCLGLFHTFHGTDLIHEPIGCAELVDGSNGSTCGDFVQDTPADPVRIFDCGNQSTCLWNCSSSYTDAHGDHYNPNTHLYMSYTFPNCMNQHTPGQVARMFSTIANSPLLQNVVYTISGSTTLCTSATYTIDNYPTGANVTWSCSSNLTLSSTTSNTATFTANWNGTGWVQATINGMLLPKKDVWVGSALYPVIESTKDFTWRQDGLSEVKEFHFLLGQDMYMNDANIQTYGGGFSHLFQWEWENGNPDGGVNIYSYGDGQILFEPYVVGTYRVRTRVTDPCGIISDWSSPVFVVVEDENTYSMELSPNPASGAVTVSITSATVKKGSTLAATSASNAVSSYLVKVLDSYGKVYYSTTKKDKKFSFTVSSLPTGVYTVSVSDGNKVYQKKLFVKH